MCFSPITNDMSEALSRDEGEKRARWNPRRRGRIWSMLPCICIILVALSTVAHLSRTGYSEPSFDQTLTIRDTVKRY